MRRITDSEYIKIVENISREPRLSAIEKSVYLYVLECAARGWEDPDSFTAITSEIMESTDGLTKSDISHTMKQLIKFNLIEKVGKTGKTKTTNLYRIVPIKDWTLYKVNRLQWLYDFATQLKSKPPRSEVWFLERYSPYVHKYDEFNEVFLDKYIPDVHNDHFMYVIEVDGDIHGRKQIKFKDAVKDLFYDNYEYTVIRIKAFDELSFETGLNEILKIRKEPQIVSK